MNPNSELVAKISEFKDRDLAEAFVRLRKNSIMSSQDVVHFAQWKFERKKDGFYCCSHTDTLCFRNTPVFRVHYTGALHPDYMPEAIESEESRQITIRIHKFLEQCLLKTEVLRPFRGPEQEDLEIEGFPELRYTAAVSASCIDGNTGIANLRKFRGTDLVRKLFGSGEWERIWEGSYNGGRII